MADRRIRKGVRQGKDYLAFVESSPAGRIGAIQDRKTGSGHTKEIVGTAGSTMGEDKTIGGRTDKATPQGRKSRKTTFEEHAEKARLSEELHVLRKEIEQLKNNSQSATRNIDDVLRIKRLKTLISELREENTKLRRQLEELGIKEVQDIEGEYEERNDEAVEAVGKTQDIEEDVLGRIRNKNVAVYGRVG